MADLPTDRPHPSCHPSGIFLLQFPGGLFVTCASGLNDSCGSVVQDELLRELTDNPETTRGTKLCVLQTILFPLLVNRGS